MARWISDGGCERLLTLTLCVYLLTISLAPPMGNGAAMPGLQVVFRTELPVLMLSLFLSILFFSYYIVILQ